MLSELSDKAQHLAEQEEWGAYRNVRYDTADCVREKGQRKRAGVLYVEVLIFDLQGVSSTPGVDGFHEAHQGVTPAIARRIARFTLASDMDEEELKTIYDRVAEQTWIDAFPRSRDEVWTDLRAAVWEHRDAIRLDEKLDALGRDQLLPEEDARSFLERKNEYEVLRRVEDLLEKEPPDQIPPEKQERAKQYLAALDPEALSDRWKAKAYRRGGEVMLSRNGTKKAREYFERALEAADPDDVNAIEQLLDRLPADG